VAATLEAAADMTVTIFIVMATTVAVAMVV